MGQMPACWQHYCKTYEWIFQHRWDMIQRANARTLGVYHDWGPGFVPFNLEALAQNHTKLQKQVEIYLDAHSIPCYKVKIPLEEE